MRSPQFWAIALCLSLAALSIHVRGDVDHVPPSTPLQLFPETIDGWHSEDIPIRADVLEILGQGDFLNRQYQRASAGARQGTVAQTQPVQLFMAYFPTQRSGQSIHSPQNCLPGSGWTFLSSGVTVFTDAANHAHRVGEYVISNGHDRQEVLYWYQSHGRSIAGDYTAKLLMLTDAIRLGRTDAALVRVITPIAPGEESRAAHRRAVQFATLITPLLSAYVPD